jgi:hypothetical protein
MTQGNKLSKSINDALHISDKSSQKTTEALEYLSRLPKPASAPAYIEELKKVTAMAGSTIANS